MLQEREKKERAERLRVNRILDDLNISLAMVDAQGTILQINKEFQRMFGFSQSQAQGKQMKELLDLEEFEFKDKHSEISLRDASGKRIKMSVRSNRVELQEQDEYIIIMVPAETSEQETEPVLTRFSQVNGDSESTEEIDPNELLRQKLCNLLNLSVKYYEYATGNNYTSLALDSGLWHATLNGTTYRAYMMERPELSPTPYLIRRRIRKPYPRERGLRSLRPPCCHLLIQRLHHTDLARSLVAHLRPKYCKSRSASLLQRCPRE